MAQDKADYLAAGLSGHLQGGVHQLPVRIYFEDTDFSGVVYHARYLHFLERGRSDFLRLSGIYHDEMQKGRFEEPLYFVVRDMMLSFKAPARIDDVVIVRSRVKTISGARLVMVQDVTLDDRVLVAAEVTVALIGEDGGIKRLPQDLKDALADVGY